MKIKLTEKKEIYNYCEPYIIAEIGANHNGDIELAKKMIDKAANLGADAVKFQSWTPDSLIAREEYERNQTYDDRYGGKKHFGSLRQMVEKYFLSKEDHFELKAYCDKIGIDFCSTPFSKEEVDLLEQLNVPFFKVASMDINNYELLAYIAKLNKPMVVSTGMATLGEIENAIKIIEKEGNHKIVILHCISIYPPKYEDINLRNIQMLQKAFPYPIGFSDHSIGTSVPLASVALGASLIEKHFTLDKDMPGWDHAVSADPIELEEIIRESKNISKALGSYSRIVSEEEEEKKLKFRRSLVLTKPIKKGLLLTQEYLTSKRPGTGIPPNELKYVVNRKVNRDIEADEILKWEDLI